MRTSVARLSVLVGLAMLLTACPAEVAEEVDLDDPADEPEEPETVEGDPLPEIVLDTTTEGYDAIRYEAAFMIAEAWEELGFSVHVEPREFATLLERFYDEQDFQATILGWSGRVDRLDPHHFLGTLYGGHADPGGNNPGGYANEEYDELFRQQREEPDEETRVEMVQRMQEIAADEMPKNVLFYRDEVVAYNNEAFEGFVEMSGEAIYNEWTPYEVTPLTDDTVLTIGTPEEPDTINPLASTSVWGWKFLRNYYDKLVRLTPDVELELWAADAIDTPDDTTYEVTLRDGMTFHDGEPVTAEDVAFSYQYNIDNEFGYFMPFLDMIESIEAPDDTTVVFNLAEPFGPFVNVTMAQIPILPQHLWADIDNPADLGPDEIPTVGSGPFQFDRFDVGEYKALTVFEDHWTAADIDIDGIDYNIYADAEGVFTGLQTGEIDMTAWRLEPGQIPLAEDEDNLTVVNAPDFGYYHLTWNLREEPFDDVAVRQALSHAIDKGTIIDVLLDGRGEPGTSVVAPSNPTWHNPDITAYDYDLDRAREILQDAGYGWNEEGQIVRP
jgi:peptide/nickel transport system substrate-binding protein